MTIRTLSLFNTGLFLNPVDEDKANDENYTPTHIVEPLITLIGQPFDLDVFSCERANQVIKAKHYFTKRDDAFSQDLTSYQNKFFQPPFSMMDRATELLLEYAHIGNSFMLCNSNTSSDWFLDCQNYSQCYLTYKKRIDFTNPKLDGTGKKQDNNRASQTLFLFSETIAPHQFKKALNHLGNVGKTI